MLTPDEEQTVLNMPIITFSKRKYDLRKFDLKLVPSDRETFMRIMNRYIDHMTETNSLSCDKTIHQIWIGQKPVPTKWLNTWSVNYINANPDWSYRLWNEQSLTDDLSMYNRDLYESEPTYHGKADIARYELLYRHGGVYIDADSIWLGSKSLTPLTSTTKFGFFCGLVNLADFPNNAVIGATKGNPLLLLLMNVVRRNSKYTKEFMAWELIGPLTFSVFTNNDIPITVYPSHYFYPKRWHGIQYTNISEDERKEYAEHSYAFHFGYMTNALEKIWTN